ncbi:ABC transporter permease [Aquicella lusitana]|uniref:Putative ABC transport system permease protein n=1 Tax=Aquicella lusitana TaxID=254246 RepID=A0A370G8N9_9COXI|nr:ABC transporter permease [Aquicella lusitana]RDI40168.1 putative ABC transport system permease protein [Aquicella lusitana]VVC72441.1 Macrolide export ATP-binding/permease protein MacB [Aquicella lusitana]
MKFVEHAREGLFNLYFSKLRSLLALLGVLVGTASVVAMVSGGELATNEALKQFKSLGTDLLAVSINSTSEENQGADGKSENLTLEQTFGLSAADRSILQVAPYTQLFYPVFYEGNPLNAMILGVSDSFADIVQIKLQSGRFISLADRYSFYCVIGRDIYEAMKKVSYKDPLGQQLQIGKNIFTIVGVAEAWPENSFVYANIDTSILVPIMASMAISKYANISNIIMRLSPQADIARVEENVSRAVSSEISGKQVTYRSAKELIAKMKKQSDILTVFLGLIGSVSLLVGGIGVMNIMLVSVTERRREIGIRLAVGAKRKDIGTLFLIEAVMLSLLGGVLGVLIGILIAYVIAALWHWEFTLFLWPPFAGFSVSVAVGIFFGFYPAYLASRLDPIEALRSE